MKVVHFSTTIDKRNGAGLAAYRLHRGLIRLGHDSTMFVAEIQGEPNDPSVTLFRPPRDLLSRARRRLRRLRKARGLARYRAARPAGYEGFSDDRNPYGAELVAQLPPCDIINIHVMVNFLDYRGFFAAAPGHAAVVRIMHDMNFFTGGCHYDAACGKHATRCGACPQLGSRKERDLSREIWQRKHVALSAVEPGRLHLVTPSRWLANEARRSALLRDFPITVIPNGSDTEVFRPRDRYLAREILRVPQDALAILFVAEPVTRHHKGFVLLAQALDCLEDVRNVLLISAGSGKPPLEVRVPHLRLGHVADERLLSLAYSAADVFVIPSLQDNCPQTVLEAMACGTPVIGFAVGGIPDMVRPGVTGLLVRPQDVTALSSAISELLRDPPTRMEMAANCRRIAVEEYAQEVQARRYVDLYGSILADRRPA